ncbi:MAG: helix-turn-helix domain-containing protein [Anaerolineae bacterium]|nr:helix-turn-helix domain-containing protein [Anaerolineae bacterium]
MKEFITTTEAAKQMNISVKEVRILCRNGALSGAYKDSNGQWQVPIDTVTNWVRERGLVNQPQWKIISLVLAQKWLPGPRMRRVITLFGAVITLIGVTIAIANDYEGAVTQLKKWGILDEIDPAEESELLVVVTEFKGNGNYDPTTRIYDALVETIEDMGIENVRVEHIFDSPLNRQEAISIGNRYGASLLIWGNFDNAGINPRLERLQEAHILSGLDGSSHIINKDFESYHFYIVNELPNLYEYFTLIAIGQIYVHKGDFDSGINIFTQALEMELPTQGLVVHQEGS